MEHRHHHRDKNNESSQPTGHLVGRALLFLDISLGFFQPLGFDRRFLFRHHAIWVCHGVLASRMVVATEFPFGEFLYFSRVYQTGCESGRCCRTSTRDLYSARPLATASNGTPSRHLPHRRASGRNRRPRHGHRHHQGEAPGFRHGRVFWWRGRWFRRLPRG